MSASTQTPSEYSVRKQLDALASGEIDKTTFLRVTLARFRFDSDESWEVLSLLDQYHRLGKIDADVFREIKTKIGEYALGPGDAVDAAVEPMVLAATPAATATATATPAAAPAEAPTLTRTATPKEAPLAFPGGREGGARQIKSASLLGTEDAPRELKVGDELRRRYRIERVLGSGGMGTVFEASDALRLDIPPMGRRIAVKVLHAAVSKRIELLQEQRLEFQHLQNLAHPNILRAYEFDRDGPLAFFTMELLSGTSLGRLLTARQRRTLPRPLALAMVRDLISAIGHAHSRGIVHGDISPDNIYVTAAGELKLLNFGRAQRTGQSPVNPVQPQLSTSTASAAYASPQVLEGDQPNVQDDIFSLACVACLLLSGHPYRESSAVEARASRMRPRRPPGLSDRQWSALRTALNFDRQKRPIDVAVWAAQLELQRAATRLPPMADLIEAPTTISSRLGLFTATAAVVLALGAAYWLATQNGWQPPWSAAAPRISPSQQFPKNDVSPAPAPATSEATPAPPAPSPNAYPVTKPQAQSAAAPVPPIARPPPASVVSSPPSPSRAKVEMISDTLDASLGDRSAQVVVRRRGSLRGETRFNWWTESGTAKPGIDFVAIVPRLERLEDGQSSVTLNVPLNNAPRAQAKSFYVVIDDAEGGAALTGRRLTMVTLPATN